MSQALVKYLKRLAAKNPDAAAVGDRTMRYRIMEAFEKLGSPKAAEEALKIRSAGSTAGMGRGTLMLDGEKLSDKQRAALSWKVGNKLRDLEPYGKWSGMGQPSLASLLDTSSKDFRRAFEARGKRMQILGRESGDTIFDYAPLTKKELAQADHLSDVANRAGKRSEDLGSLAQWLRRSEYKKSNQSLDTLLAKLRKRGDVE